MAKNRKRKTPAVLWRLFRHRARTLADTIVSMISFPPPECGCNGQRCIGCSGGDAVSFLLRPHDPFDYCKLLSQCFVVVSPNAPPFSTFCPDRRWSQQQIVRRTIEMIMCEQPGSSNVISCGYDKCNNSSPIVELLCCSAWGLLLERVGDGIMVYLLKHTSIFVPLPHKKHHQVTGPPISDLCIGFSKHKSDSEHQNSSFTDLGSQKKRKRDDGLVDLTTEEQQLTRFTSVGGPLGFINCVGCNGKSYLRSFSRSWRKRCRQMSLSEATMQTSGVGIASSTEDLSGECQQIVSQRAVQHRKRFRPSKCQPAREHRQLNFQGTIIPGPCPIIPAKKDNLIGRLQHGFDASSSHHHDKCSCCLLLQASQRVSPRAYIDRKSMFHRLDCSSSVFPRSHIINSLKPNFSDANVLLMNILGLSDVDLTLSKQCFHKNAACLIGSACLCHSLVSLLVLLIRRTQSCQPLRLLDKHCAVQSSCHNGNENAPCMFEGNKSGMKSSEKGQLRAQLDSVLPLKKSHVYESRHFKKSMNVISHQSSPNKSYCSKSQVVSFIWAVCRKIVPSGLLGTPSNCRILRKKISKLVWLRRFEKLSLTQCMYKLKVSRFPLLSNKHSCCYLSKHVPEYATGRSIDMCKRSGELNDAFYVMKLKILERWIFWFFSFLVVPLVQANFYVTESEHGKNDLFYYRKSVWEKLTHNANTCLKQQSYHSLDDASVRKILSNRSFGFSRLRFRLKESGIRALANLNGSSRIPVTEGMQRNTQLHPERVKFDYFKPVNSVLRDLHAVLKGLQMKEPKSLGSSVFDYNDVYRKLCPFLISVKNGSKTPSGIFVVVSDVSKAFDSVNQDKLLCVMKDVILKGRYLLNKSREIVCTRKSFWVHEDHTLVHQNIGTGLTGFLSSVSSHSLHSVLVNQMQRRSIGSEELLFNLNEHVKRNVLQLGNDFYLQESGIPQGSIVSSLLCSFYYGHLDRNVVFPFLEKTCGPATENVLSCEDSTISSSPKYMLLRYIDDFLFLSTSKQQAASFFSRLQRGFRDYNCYMNEGKFGMNFNAGHISELPSNRRYVGEDGISFLRWSGLLINCCSLEVQADYTRYTNNHLNSTLTVCWQDPVRHLKARLFNYMQIRCHPLFYDSNINSAAVVRLNIYQAFLLSAMKFHCYVHSLSNTCKLQPGYYLEIIVRALRRMYALIKRRMHSMDLGSGFCPILQLKKGEVLWLGLNAFVRVLKRKQCRYKELLSLMRSKLSAHSLSETASSQLKYAIDDSHSSLLWKIKY